MNKTLKTIWNAVTWVIVAAAVLLAVLLVGARLVGLRTFTVLSGSMEPTYHTGSLIYVKKVDAANLSEGTVITFMLDEDTVATHRIVGVVPDEDEPGVVRYRTKGDANEVEDGSLVHYKNVIGTPVFSIPKLGYVANYIQHPPGTYVTISVGAMVLLLMFLPELIGVLTADNEKEEPKEKKARKEPPAKKEKPQKETKRKGGAHCAK
ncbi:MAG: signal peptidase I [Candidatus Limivicinus sp.]|nr:signal peptidase I [Candidatus Limivicinus sp.]